MHLGTELLSIATNLSLSFLALLIPLRYRPWFGGGLYLKVLVQTFGFRLAVLGDVVVGPGRYQKGLLYFQPLVTRPKSPEGDYLLTWLSVWCLAVSSFSLAHCQPCHSE